MRFKENPQENPKERPYDPHDPDRRVCPVGLRRNRR